MSHITKTLHRKNYAAIDAGISEQSQAGRRVLITGGSATIGRAAAEAFVTAGAETVIITSRDALKASKIAKEIEANGQSTTKVHGYQMELCDIDSINRRWDQLARDGIELDILILNATDLIAPAAEGIIKLHMMTPKHRLNLELIVHVDDKLATYFKYFESGVRNQLVNIDRFRAQGPQQNKVLLYVSTNATHIHQLPLHYTAASSPRIAMNRIMSDLAMNIPADQLQILSIHPGFVLTPENMKHGYTADTFAPVRLDDESLPGNFYVWASTKKAAFLHGRFVWTNWDVDELLALKPKIEADQGFLRMGLQGAESQDFPMLLEGMGRAV